MIVLGLSKHWHVIVATEQPVYELDVTRYVTLRYFKCTWTVMGSRMTMWEYDSVRTIVVVGKHFQPSKIRQNRCRCHRFLSRNQHQMSLMRHCMLHPCPNVSCQYARTAAAEIADSVTVMGFVLYFERCTPLWTNRAAGWRTELNACDQYGGMNHLKNSKRMLCPHELCRRGAGPVDQYASSSICGLDVLCSHQSLVGRFMSCSW